MRTALIALALLIIIGGAVIIGSSVEPGETTRANAGLESELLPISE